MNSVLYVSRSRLREDQAAAEVDTLIRRAREHNRAARISGALIFTGTRFAQFIEGPAAEVDRLMSRILLDRRHDQVKIVSVQPCTVRRFGSWQMAYNGLSSYVDRHIRLLAQDLSDVEQLEGRDALLELMLAFGEQGGSEIAVSPSL